MKDFKDISLELLNKNVLIILKISADLYKECGSEVMGTLISRNMGTEVNRFNIYETNAETVVSLTIKRSDGSEIEVPCQDIKFISYCLI